MQDNQEHAEYTKTNRNLALLAAALSAITLFQINASQLPTIESRITQHGIKYDDRHTEEFRTTLMHPVLRFMEPPGVAWTDEHYHVYKGLWKYPIMPLRDNYHASTAQKT